MYPITIFKMVTSFLGCMMPRLSLISLYYWMCNNGCFPTWPEGCRFNYFSVDSHYIFKSIFGKNYKVLSVSKLASLALSMHNVPWFDFDKLIDSQFLCSIVSDCDVMNFSMCLYDSLLKYRILYSFAWNKLHFYELQLLVIYASYLHWD